MDETAITIGELAKRSGVAASAIRFYEEQGLITSTRTEGRPTPISAGDSTPDWLHSCCPGRRIEPF